MFRRNATSTIALLLAGSISLAPVAYAFAQDDDHGRHAGQNREERREGQPQRQQQAAPQAPAQNFQPRGNWRNEGAPQGGGQESRGRRFEQAPQANAAPRGPQQNIQQAPAQNFQPRGNWRNEGQAPQAREQAREQEWRGRRFEQAPQANPAPRAPQQNFQQPPAQNFRRAPDAQPTPQRDYRDYAERRYAPAPDQRRDFAARPAPQQQYAQRYDGRRDSGRGGPGTTMRVDGWRDHRWAGPRTSLAIHRRPYVPAYYRPHYLPRERWFRDVYVYRPYGLAYPGFGFYYTDDEAYRWLGLASLSFAAYSELDEMEQRAADEALIEATDAEIGESITWNEDGASGSVTPIRDGESADGRPCREFQEDVVIDGRRQTAYGTACVQQDGSWQVVNN